MESNAFLLFNLDKTKAAISELQNLLLCDICHQRPTRPISLGRCDHLFCSECLVSANDTCVVCQIPTPPHARTKDNVVAGLLSSADDLLKIFNGETILLDTQGIEAPESTDFTKPYCSKTPSRPLKVQKKTKLNYSSKYTNSSLKKHDDKLLCKEVPKTNKENCSSNATTPQANKLVSTSEPTTPKHQSAMKPQDMTPAINKRNAKGETSMHSCCIKGNLEKVKTLLDEGANPNTKDNAGWTPLHEASSHGFLEIAELLLQKGALVNVPGNNNETPLHDSVSSSCLEMICLLRKWGADPTLKDTWGRTPRDLAAINSSQEVSEALETAENPDLVAIPKQLPAQTKVIIMDSNLTPDCKKRLMQLSKQLKIRLVHEFCAEVTHVVVMCNDSNICQRTVKYMTAVVSGKTIVSNKWIDACLAVNGIVSFLEFEVVGTTASPSSRAPEMARKNTNLMKPNLLNGCHIYFQGMSSDDSPSKRELETFIKAGGGIYLQREPNPESIGDVERTVPFHYRSNGRLSKCSHFCLYKDGVNEPLMKYDMPHLKSLSFSWLTSCVEKFEIID